MGFLEDRANLTGRVAVIAGGARGLGGAIARDLAQAGVNLALCDRDEQALEATTSDAAEAGRNVVKEAIDVREPPALRNFFERADALGQLDILVNVVGGTYRQDFDVSSPQGWEALIRTNYTWLLHSTSLAIPRIRAGQRGGSIINLTSIEAHRAAPGYAVYAGLKAAVTNFSRSLAVELGADGIRVNTIAPDMVPTERVFEAADEGSGARDWGDDEYSNSQIAFDSGRPSRSIPRTSETARCSWRRIFPPSDGDDYSSRWRGTRFVRMVLLAWRRIPERAAIACGRSSFRSTHTSGRSELKADFEQR